jgi:glutamyl-Q tRNA(Asp) synthetase
MIFDEVVSDKDFAREDFIIKRRDGLFAYQLVVVIDDIDQGITEVVRGADIMELTCRQLSLYQLFDVPAPNYAHLPLAVIEPGFKLSKQNKAQPINPNKPQAELVNALKFLGLPVEKEQDLTSGRVNDILEWAVNYWSLEIIPASPEIIVA